MRITAPIWKIKEKQWQFTQWKLTWAWRYMTPAMISLKYLLAELSPIPPGVPAGSHTHVPSTYSKTTKRTCLKNNYMKLNPDEILNSTCTAESTWADKQQIKN